MKIYVSGGSGVGKSHFCQEISSKFQMWYTPESIRHCFDEEDFAKIPLMMKQLILTVQSFKDAHLKDPRIYDRCILDVFAWIKQPQLIKYVANALRSPDLVIIAPTYPDVKFYRDNIFLWKKDAVRWKTFQELLGFDADIDDHCLANLIHHHEKIFEESLVYMCKQLGWKYFLPLVDTGFCDTLKDCQESWQEQAEDMIKILLEKNSCLL